MMVINYTLVTNLYQKKIQFLTRIKNLLTQLSKILILFYLTLIFRFGIGMMIKLVHIKRSGGMITKIELLVAS